MANPAEQYRHSEGLRDGEMMNAHKSAECKELEEEAVLLLVIGISQFCRQWTLNYTAGYIIWTPTATNALSICDQTTRNSIQLL